MVEPRTDDHLPNYEVFAIRYGRLARRRNDNFIANDPLDALMPMDYFVWVVRDARRAWLVDCGFDEAAGRARGRERLRCPIEALSPLGILPEAVSDLILTHLHYDHAGNVSRLPNARLHLQEAEMHFATGHHMTWKYLRHPYTSEHVTEVVRQVYRDRVTLHAGDVELAPGLQLIKIGGHTAGLQSVRVHTARGWVMLASDASHFYENMHAAEPFPIVFQLAEVLAGFDRLRNLADSLDHIIPGHDPLVAARYPCWGNPVNDIFSLHEPPIVVRPRS